MNKFNKGILSVAILGSLFISACNFKNQEKITLIGETTIEVGTSTLLSLQVENMRNATFSWESSNIDVATVKNGYVTGISEGKTTIKAVYTEDLSIFSELEINVVTDINDEYTVKFYDYDDTLLYETSVKKGEDAVFKGETPVRLNTYDIKYEFSHWDKELTNVSEDIVTHAVYTESDFSDYYFEDGGTTYKFVGYSGNEETLVIPTTFNGKYVTTIGTKCLSGNSSVKKIIIPEGIGVIDQQAFTSLTSLTEISFPASLYSIGSLVCYGCTNLTKVTLTEGLTSLGEYMFQNCTGLTEITFPESLTKIGNYAFFQTGLIKVEVPSTVTSFGNNVFSNMPNLTEAIVNADLKELPQGTFSSCKALIKVSITSPNMTELGQAALMSCTSLNSLTLPDSISKIGDRTLKETSSLKELEIPTSLRDLGDDSFTDSALLDNDPGLVIKESDTTHIKKDGYLLSDSGTSILMVLDSSVVTANLSFTSLGVTRIGSYAFFENTTIKSVDLTGITSIGDSAFDGCKNITGEITFSNEVTHIGSRAFAYAGLSKITFEGVVDDGEFNSGIFRNCTKLNSVILPSGTLTIGDRMFGWCGTKFTSCYIPKTVTKIDEYAFQSDTKLVITYEGSKEEFDNIELVGTYAVPSSIKSNIIYEGK